MMTTTWKSLSLAILVAAIPAPPGLAQPQADDDDATNEPDVDPTPYLEAMTVRFRSCAEEEGYEFDEEGDADALATLEALANMMVSHDYDGDCVTSESAMQQCANAIASRTCEEIHADIEGMMSGQLPGSEPPAWATTYGTTISGKVLQCYLAEAGLEEAEASVADDLEMFANIVATSMGTMDVLCEFDQAKFDVCVASLANIDCVEMATYLDSDPQTLVQNVMGACEGFLDCGF
jgi:hypothetical protein